MSRNKKRGSRASLTSQSMEDLSATLSGTSITKQSKSESRKKVHREVKKRKDPEDDKIREAAHNLKENEKRLSSQNSNADTDDPKKSSSGGLPKSAKFSPKTLKLQVGRSGLEQQEGLIKTTENKEPSKRWSKEALSAKRGKVLKPDEE